MSTLPAVPLRLRFRAAEGEADNDTVTGWLAEVSDSEEKTELESVADQLISDVADMVEQFLARRAKDVSLAAYVVKALGENRITDIHSVGTIFCQIATRSIEIHDRILEAVQRVRTLSSFSGIPELEKLQDAKEDYVRWLNWFKSSWPWVDHEQLQRSYASYEQGSYRPMTRFLDELPDSTNPRG